MISVMLSACGSSKSTTEAASGPIDTDDCYPHRRTIQEFVNKEGLIGLVGPNYIITSIDGKQRYQACTLPEAFHQEDMEIIYTGTQVEILPGERRYAKPMRLRSIVEKKSK